MKLKLTRPICFFDLETTGLSVAKDRIVEISVVKLFPDGTKQERTRRLNPTILISPEATKTHGITNEMVANEPTFKQVAKGLYELVRGCDLGGFNVIRYDLPMLHEEFSRAGIELDLTDVNIVDSLRIFHKFEQRTLAAAYQFYCGKKLDGAHSALADTMATVEIMEAQLDRYKDVVVFEESDGTLINNPIKNDVKVIYDFVKDKGILDNQGKIKFDENQNEYVFTFGKYQDKPVGESLASDHGYMKWIVNGDFTTDTKNHVNRLYNEFIEKKNLIPG